MRYLGEWKEGKFEGKGKLFKNGKMYYEGGFERGVMEGKGKMFLPDGAVYEGEMRSGKFHGKGTLTTDNYTYKGGWAENKKHG